MTLDEEVSLLHGLRHHYNGFLPGVHRLGIQEIRGKGANVILGPAICIHRVPVNGRNFEYLSGEDPHLGSRLSRSYVQGVQSQNVIATPKHYLNNNQEYHRQSISVTVDWQSEHELYFPPFLAAMEAGAGSLMCSYNRINGTFACANEALLKIAHDAFDGFIVSDWGAAHSFSDGLDVAMPNGNGVYD